MQAHDKESDGNGQCPEGTVMGEVQLLLAEKRTSLATLRTGIAVEALPLSVLGLLVATSKYYEVDKVMHLLGPLLALSLALAVLGGWLVFRAMVRIRRQERAIQRIKEQYSSIAHLIQE